jgi:predicted enzyme related to lactoylglutathione lyase
MTVGLLVNVDVDDLDRAVAFYSDAFGLAVGRRFGDVAVEMLGTTAPLYLLAKAAGSRATPGTRRKRTYRRHWTPVHLDFVVDDLEAALVHVEAAGGRREGKVHESAGARYVVVADPFGHGLCLVQFVGRGYDEMADAPASFAVSQLSAFPRRRNR